MYYRKATLRAFGTRSPLDMNADTNMYNPRKPYMYHFISQWQSVPDYVLTTVGRTPPSNVRTYEHMEHLKYDGSPMQKLAWVLVWTPQYVDKWTSRSSMLQRFLTARTGYTKISFDRQFQNVVIFEGTYSPKAYLEQWKKKNGLIFVLFITDVNQFDDLGRYNISASPYDYVVSQYAPPPDFERLVDLNSRRVQLHPAV